MTLTKAQILKKKKLAKVEVEIPEWGGSVIVTEMSGKQRDEWEKSMLDLAGVKPGEEPKQDLANARAKLAIATLVDDEGNPLFEMDDLVAVGDLSSSALTRIYGAALKVNALSEEDIKELEGN